MMDGYNWLYVHWKKNSKDDDQISSRNQNAYWIMLRICLLYFLSWKKNFAMNEMSTYFGFGVKNAY